MKQEVTEEIGNIHEYKEKEKREEGGGGGETEKGKK